MNGRRWVVLLLAALALVAAGCGGDDSNEAGGDTDTAIVETDGDETTDDATENTDDDASGTSTDGALGGECAELAGLGARISQAVTGGNEGLEEASELFDQLASRVPEEIRDDFEVIAENFSQVAEAVQELDLAPGETPGAEDLARLQELTESLSSPEVAAAGERIQAWTEENC
jgi:hypothetical protein